MYWQDRYLYHCEKQANKMYPNIYNDVYPYVKRMCDMTDNPFNPAMHPFPSKEKVDEMVENIYSEYEMENKRKYDEKDYDELFRIDGRRDFTRDLIRILLLRELLRRRRRRRRPFYDYYDYYDYYY